MAWKALKTGCYAILGIVLAAALVAETGRNVTFAEKSGNKAAKENRNPFHEQKMKMIEKQIAARGVTDQNVLSAFRQVDRHRYVPKHLQHMAYEDRPLPIGEGQTISQPYIVAFMTEALNLSDTDRVLEIGTGSGYQAAILAEIVAHVYTIEIVESLGRRAKEVLDAEGYANIDVKIGDGFQGWPEHAPFDAIMVTCAPTDVPEPLKEQLAEGGTMIIPVGPAWDQKLVLLEKRDGKLVEKESLPVRFVPMVDEDGKTY